MFFRLFRLFSVFWNDFFSVGEVGAVVWPYYHYGHHHNTPWAFHNGHGCNTGGSTRKTGILPDLEAEWHHVANCNRAHMILAFVFLVFRVLFHILDLTGWPWICPMTTSNRPPRKGGVGHRGALSNEIRIRTVLTIVYWGFGSPLHL